ncbi:MAG TPA: retropepsin-like aspartic protease [Ideonella sp.]|nr:retropepsin-like aspartic protease [Ideonella sp.]
MNELPRTFKLVTVWLLLGTAVFIGMQHLLRERSQPRVMVSDGVVTLDRAGDGHYHWPGRINGQAVSFLIDTGATRTTLPGSLARELGLPRGATVRTQTAAGPATGYTTTIDLLLDGGPSARRLPVTVMETMEGPPLLGMDLLGLLRIEQGQGRMRLAPPS